MTEAKWFEAIVIDLKVRDFALRRLSDRKRRLFACACCRRIWKLLFSAELREGVEAAELIADGLLDKKALADIRKRIEPLASDKFGNNFHACAVKWALDRNRRFPLCSSQYASEAVAVTAKKRSFSDVYTRRMEAEQAKQIVLLRDVLGNPFHPTKAQPAWLTSTVVAMARGMYESRDFSAMPILADALQDAGCEVPEVLDHCRDANGVHVRGCWVVDLLLGKE